MVDDKIIIAGSASVALLIAYCCDCMWSAIFYIGLVRLLLFYSSVAHFINKFFIRKRLNLIKRYGDGSYALVTGGANGIGLEYAIQLAEAGFNIIILDLSDELLEKAKEKILEKAPKADVVTKVRNLCEMTKQEHYEEFMDEVKEYDISVLVNNAGVADYHQFHETTPASVSRTIQVNAIAVLGFTRMFYTRFMNREKKGGIINMASGVGLASNSLVPIYPSTKAFVKYLTEGLQEECKGKIDLLYIYPGAVTTSATAFRVAPDSTTPDVIARNALNSLGQDGYNAGYWLHDIFCSQVEAMFYCNRELYRFVEDAAVEKTGLGKDLRDIAKAQDKKDK